MPFDIPLANCVVVAEDTLLDRVLLVHSDLFTLGDVPWWGSRRVPDVYDGVIYPSYSAEPPVFGLSPLTDQILAGALMWVSGIFIFVGPAVLITFQLLCPQPKTTGFSHS